MWIYKGEEFKQDDVTDDMVGFVYIITNPDNGMKYIGKKKFNRKITRPPLKGKKRKRHSTAPSDWMEYVGSNTDTQQLKEDRGVEFLKREILHICKSLGEMSYIEAKEQFDRDVLLRDDYYNGIIQCRINHKHVKNLWKY